MVTVGAIIRTSGHHPGEGEVVGLAAAIMAAETGTTIEAGISCAKVELLPTTVAAAAVENGRNRAGAAATMATAVGTVCRRGPVRVAAALPQKEAAATGATMRGAAVAITMTEWTCDRRTIEPSLLSPLGLCKTGIALHCDSHLTIRVLLFGGIEVVRSSACFIFVPELLFAYPYPRRSYRSACTDTICTRSSVRRRLDDYSYVLYIFLTLCLT